MAKKNGLPLWMINAALAAMQNKAYWQSCEQARAKYPDTDAGEAWVKARDAWMDKHPCPESTGRINAKREAAKNAFEKKAERRANAIWRAANAGKLTETELLKLVEEF